ncbi:synaptotagmin-like protein 2 isoform X2 [Pipistrellus kuhlii]|uniref:synaptotagmin-like protein 2 isoform X2 n=1 Tax=Pipistrellus kuhlii TaxID=59472 RepID=UPI00174F024E|nr:synaptotagmin-like protein 2 isoform X2 [Pipistrellus kuhlii]
MIDLSFLTEEEQEAIMKVLQRDAALKRVEDERVRHLPEKVKDDQQLKNMSGQWFYEAKAKRHRDKIHGTDIIRASMRKKRLQVAAEQSKDRENRAKESWVNNVNKDAFLPPELAGVVEEAEEDVGPASPSPSVADPASTMIDTSQENSRNSAASSAKQRKNPFNSSKLPEDHLSPQTKNEQSRNGRTGFFQTSKEGELSGSKEESPILDSSSQTLEKPKQTLPGPESGSHIKPPIPKARKMIYKSPDLKQDDHQLFPGQRTDLLKARGAPRGILKRNSSSSSTDSDTVRFHQSFEPKSKIGSPGLTIHERISEKEHSLEDKSSSSAQEPLKHVRFSAVKEELPRSPGLIQGREVGEFSVLESNRLKNGIEDVGDEDEFWKDPTPSQYREPLPLPPSASSPSALKHETNQPKTPGPSPSNGQPSPLKVLPARPQSSENSPTIREHEAKSSELSRLESELSKSPADERSHVESEPSQVPDRSSRDHQQGKPPLLKALKAKTFSHSGPHATEIRKTTDDSISKVLDWFNRSSHLDDSKSPLQQPQGTEPREKADSKPQASIAMVTDDISLKDNGSKALLSTNVELTPVGSDLMFQAEGHVLPPGNCQDSNVDSKSKSINLPQQGKEGPGILQPLEAHSPNQKSKTMDYSQASKHRDTGNGIPHQTSNYPCSALSKSDAAGQVPCNIKDVGSLGEEEPKLRVYEKETGNSEVNFDSAKIVKERSSKDNMKSGRESKGGDTHFLKVSAEPENIELLPGAASNKSPRKKPEVQLPQEAGEVPKNQVQREKYKRVSDRISFWEGENAAARVTHKEPKSSHSQGPPSAKVYQPGRSMDNISRGQNEYNQVTAKKVVLDEDGQVAHLSSSYSLNKPKESGAQISGPSKNYPSADQSDKASLFQNMINEPVKRWPAADSSHSGGDLSLPVPQHPSNVGSEIPASLEKDRSLIAETNPNFKIMSLKERMDEPSTEQVYNHSQFENLRKFWDLGANSNIQDNVEKNTTKTSQKDSAPFNSQKHKEFHDLKSSGENAHEIDTFLSPPKLPATEEIEGLNSKCRLQVLPRESTFPLEPPTKSPPPLPGNESPKENVQRNMEWLVTPVFNEDKDCSDQEIQECIVKTRVMSKDYKDTLNDSLQKLLSEASSPAIQPSGETVHGQQVLEPGASGNGTWPRKKDAEEAAKGPRDIVNEQVDKTVAPPKVKPSTWAASLDKLLKEGTGTLPSSPLQTKLEPITPRINSEPGERRVFEKGVEQSHSSSSHQREIIAPFPRGKETLGKTSLPLQAENGEYQLNSENLFQMAAGGSHPVDQPSRLHRKDSLGIEAKSPQDMPSSSEAHLGPQDKALSPQREVSETVEKVIVPPKSALNDVNVVLQKLLREAMLPYPVGREVVPGEVKAEFPEGGQATGSLPNSPGAIPPSATVDMTVPDRKDAYSFRMAVLDKTHDIASHLAAPVSLSEQIPHSFGSTVTQYSKELPQEVTEIVRETILRPKSGLLELSASLEKLLKETTETLSSESESNPGMFSPSQSAGCAEVPRTAASEFHPEEIKETVQKAEAPAVTESTFDIGFEKLLRESSEAPPYEPQVSGKEGTPKKETSKPEQARFLGRTQEAPEMKLKSDVFESRVNPWAEGLRGEAVSGLSVDVCGYESGAEIPGNLSEDHETGLIETTKPPEHRESESEVVRVREGVFREPGCEEGPKTVRVSRNRQPVPLLTNKENSTKRSKVELVLESPYKRQEKEEGKEGVSDSDFSDGNIGPNAESWRNTSSSEEEPSPVLKTLERSAARKMPSKSLEDISSDSSNQAKIDNLPEELVRSAEDVSTVPSQPDNQFSHPDKLKRMSKSVPAFLQDESDDRETDTASESSYHLSRHKKSPSSLTNLSSSSGMTSLSSVSGSVMSVYSGDFGNLEVKGSIQFAVEYVDSLTELHIFVAQCKDLAAADMRKQRSDPYVKTYLLPDKGKMGKKKTFVVKKTLNPVYNEILRYKIEKQILKTQKLNLSVWHRDTFKRNSFLGEVELDLETWDWDSKQNKQLKWYPLKRKTAPVALEAENRGKMKLALQYVPEPIPGKKLPTTGEVHIWVKECLDLPMLRGSHLNSFVKCIILPDTSRKSRQRTRAVGKTTNPVFNHTMVYDGFRPEDLTEACVELTVWDHYKLTNQFLGGLRIGFGTGKSYDTEVDWMDSTSEEVALWEKMVNSPNTWIEAILPLRMLLIAKISK